MRHHARHGTLVTVAVIALGLLAPGAAFGHDLGIYKNEAQVDLVSDEQTASVGCDGTDQALDGMWRIDHADQDDDVEPMALISGAADVLAASPSSGSTYSFTFAKNAVGRVQAKIWVLCLKSTTQGGAHTHSLTGAFTQADGSTPGFESTTQNDLAGSASVTAPLVSSATGSCPNGTRLVSPGFAASDFRSGGVASDPPAGVMRLFESISTTGANWSWKFENSALPAGDTLDLTTTYRCLRIKVPQGAYDKHKLVTKFKNPVTATPAADRASTRLYTCGSFYKAVVSGFRIATDPADLPNYGKDGEGLFATTTSSTAFNNLFYLGMDPRPRTRAFRFANRHATNDTNTVTLRSLCLNYRTT